MTTLHENYVSLLEGIDTSDRTWPECSGEELEASIDRACDCLAFVQALWDVYAVEGAHDGTLPPDIAMMENLFDALQGELAAAALFLSENSFARVPDMLRSLESKLLSEEAGGIVPRVVARGFSRFATRIENVRKQQQLMMKVVSEAEDSPATKSPTTDIT
jgi:hypothetical protein